MQGGLEKKDITALLTRAAELAEEAGQRPGDRHTDAAFVIAAALQASRGLVSYADFLPVRGEGGMAGARADSAWPERGGPWAAHGAREGGTPAAPAHWPAGCSRRRPPWAAVRACRARRLPLLRSPLPCCAAHSLAHHILASPLHIFHRSMLLTFVS